MMKNLEQPNINIEEIQKAANEAAKKAYLKEIENYYTGYNSSYRKLISKELKNQKFNYPLYLPDIMQEINEKIIKEIDVIANQAIAMSFIPMLTYACTGMEKHINMSDILSEIIREVDPEPSEYEDFYFNYNEHQQYNWLNCELTTPNNHYEFTLHTVHETEKTEKVKYQLLSFPRNSYKTGYNSNMKIRKDDIEIEMPFTPGVLEDKVLTVFFKTMLSKCEIKMDCSDFEDDMFPEKECYCD